MSDRKKLSPPVEASVLFDGAAQAERLALSELTLQRAFIPMAPPHPAPGTPLVLWLASQPDDVPPLLARVISSDSAPRAGCHIQFDGVTPAQRHMLTVRYCQGPSGGAATELRWLLVDAPTELADFCSLHPYPFLLAGVAPSREPSLLRADHLVYLVRSRRTAIGSFCPVHVGRDARSDIAIDDERVSRQHAVFDHGPERVEYVLLDKGSRNGTRVDMVPLRPMEPRVVTSGSAIFFGDLPFLFFSPKALFHALTSSGLLDATRPRASHRTR